jgi:protein-L-isoaspartate(D-aspartate) O-methyltransferase
VNMRHRGIGMTSMRTRERLIRRLQDNGISDPRVLDAMRVVPRHIFVDEALSSRAYEDTALPIGHGQTISQPYIVARMTEALLTSGPLDSVLEIGTGSGYQAAILAHVAGQVFTLERIQPLLTQARQRFQELKLRNIRTHYADGTIGWPEQAPFDGIIATAAPEHIPEALLAQLKIGGRLIIPVGQQGYQKLMLITRTADDNYEQQGLEAVSFVPMLSGNN